MFAVNSVLHQQARDIGQPFEVTTKAGQRYRYQAKELLTQIGSKAEHSLSIARQKWNGQQWGLPAIFKADEIKLQPVATNTFDLRNSAQFSGTCAAISLGQWTYEQQKAVLQGLSQHANDVFVGPNNGVIITWKTD